MKNQIAQVLKSLESLNSSCRFNSLVQLDFPTAYCVLAADALMKRPGKIQGVEQHCRFRQLIDFGVRSESDLRSWIQASFQGLDTGRWDACRKQADEFLESGVNVFAWHDPGNLLHFINETTANPGLKFSPADRSLFSAKPRCPSVLFGKGDLEFDLPLLAVFNSRKPRFVSPDSKWLEALRFFFRSLDRLEIALAASTGTLTYDMVHALALRSGLVHLLVSPSPLQTVHRNGNPVLSCMLDSATCSGKQAPICRDRIVAALANLHLVLEIRARGNLLDVLEEIQANSPRPELIFDPGERNPSNAGNYVLLSRYPEHACVFKPPETPGSKAANSIQTASFAHSRLRVESWSDYLFHYTRACAGPWPGETYDQYLLNLFDARPLSGHSALETLIRILQEGQIRAGARMVRGPEAVISWSSHPPHELFLMRKWNRALVRWTVEPYGIAVRRDILRSLGAKPAVYGSDQVYSRLVEPERYRFQLSRSAPSASWRHEREWRLRGDLALSSLNPGDGFVFVKTEEEKAKFCSHINPGLSIVALDASR